MASNKQGGSQRDSGQKGSGNNFANDPQKAAEEGKKGGKASGTSHDKSHDKSSDSGHKGGRS